MIDLDACGADTPWGCKHGISEDWAAHLILRVTPPRSVGGHNVDNGARLFHAGRCCPCPSCLGLIAVVPNAFSRGLVRELQERSRRVRASA